jgi:hypothetical protein
MTRDEALEIAKRYQADKAQKAAMLVDHILVQYI